MRFVIQIFLLSALIATHASAALSAQLTNGKYFGTIEIDGQSEAIAASLDAFTLQAGDPSTFPQLNVILRVNLGGFFSSEYVAYNFYDPTFNFEKGVLQLDDPSSEMTAQLRVTNTGSQTILGGPIFYRSTNSKGTIRLTMDVDSDNLTATSTLPPAKEKPLLSKLNGEYFGTCGSTPAVLQIETGRELGSELLGNALKGYSITGRVGYRNADCSDIRVVSHAASSTYCNELVFSRGAYRLYNGEVLLQGPHATADCRRDADALTCTVHRSDGDQSCKLTKKPTAPARAVQFPQRIFINVSSGLKTRLPDPLPPQNESLVSALGGNFFGYLHHENRDVYQLMQLSVVASTSTENPHIQNQVLVAPTASLFLGSEWSGESVVSTHFPQRVFYLNPGFSFLAVDADSFVVIGDWRQGYISGVWYSRTYGRIGTFELQKDAPPPVPKEMSVVTDLTGAYDGPMNGPPSIRNWWWLQLTAPGQVVHGGQTTMSLLGQFRIKGGVTVVRPFDAASFDISTGSVSLMIQDPLGDRIISGAMISATQLDLAWPVGPGFGAPIGEHDPLHYLKRAAQGGKK